VPLSLDFSQTGVVLSFRLFDIPIKVRVSFLAVAVFLGFSGNDLSAVVAWVGVVFVSILVHELGHALTARHLGAEVAIELNAIGGLTRWGLREGEMSPGRRALLAASGSAVGVVFGGLVWLIDSQFGPYSGTLAFVIKTLIRVNIFWGLLNWLPIRPLDGGHLLLSLLEKVSPAKADSIARVVFTVTAGIALWISIGLQLYIIAFLSGWLLLSEFSRGRPAAPQVPMPTLSYDHPGEIIDIEPDPEEPTQ
jgi:stage IV sporulation protein FB